MAASVDTSTRFTSAELISALLSALEIHIMPLTSQGVSSGSKVFGAAILSNTTLEPHTVATNNESLSPLLHGEINCIQQFFTVDFPDPKTRPNPREGCIFFATHEPCSLCLSGIAWSGFKEVYYLFTHEDSRDLFSIPYDIDILEQVFGVETENRVQGQVTTRTLYNRENKFFRAKAVAEIVAEVDDAIEGQRLTGEINRVKEAVTILQKERGDGDLLPIRASSLRTLDT